MTPPSYRLETLGTVVLKGPDLAIRAADQRQQRRRLGLLAALASAGDRGMSRDQLLLLFWPDSTQKKARHSLDQLLYAIRTSLGESIFLGSNPIRLNPDCISADVCDFNSNLAEGKLEVAAAGYPGPFLDGFYLSDTREFEEWAESERRRLAHTYENALEQLASGAEKAGDYTKAVHWRRKLVEADPVSTRHALALMKALARDGDVTAAIAYGERYDRENAELIGETGSKSVRKLMAQLRELPVSEEFTRLSPPSQREIVRPPPPRRFRAPILAALAVVMAIGVGGTILSGSPILTTDPDDQRRGTSNLAAYDLYLRGRDPVVMRNDSTAQLALDYFRQAIELDSGFAAAHAGVSTMYTRLAMSNAPAIPRVELRRRAIQSARKAISLNDSLAEAHTTLGLINSYWLINFRVAQAHLERAIAIDPKNPQAREYLALTYLYLGRPSDALREMQEAVAQNPLSPTARAMLAAHQYIIGRCDLALPALDSLAAMTPPLLRVAVTRSLCFASSSDWEKAATAVRNEESIRTIGLLGFALAKQGRRSEAIEVRTKLRDIARSNPAAFFDATVISFGLGEIDSSIAELQVAVDAGVLPWEFFGPVFDDLRADPRVRKIAASKGVATNRTFAATGVARD